MGIVVAVIVAVVVLLLVIGIVASRQVGRTPGTAPAGAPNPFAQEGEYVNPLAGREEANPFYVNPFGRFKEEKPAASAPAENPFGTPTP